MKHCCGKRVRWAARDYADAYGMTSDLADAVEAGLLRHAGRTPAERSEAIERLVAVGREHAENWHHITHQFDQEVFVSRLTQETADWHTAALKIWSHFQSLDRVTPGGTPAEELQRMTRWLQPKPKWWHLTR